MATPRPFTSQVLDPLLLRLPPDWRAAEIGKPELGTLGIRGDTIVGAAMSGVAPGQGAPLSMYGRDVVAGITVLRHEMTPQVGEPEGNADHYVVTRTNHHSSTYLLYGPFRSQASMAGNAGIPHWFDATELGRFVDSIRHEMM